MKASFATLLVLVFLMTATLVQSRTQHHTLSSCQKVGPVEVQWTCDEANNRLTAKFVIPNASGYASVGFKQGTTRGMAQTTILLGYGNAQVNEYYADSNSMPTRLSSNQFISANSSTVGSTTTLSLVRSLSRPGNAPSTYYAFSKGTNTTLLFATSSSVPTSPQTFSKHDSTMFYALAVDFYNNNINTCGGHVSPSQSIKKPSGSTSVKRNSAERVSGSFAMWMVSVAAMTAVMGLVW
ncbi:hypothetical protein C9374_009833 [Naegleria lovaniensis]|uniref:DOMON domain-containing protein n=1 Tax=Naegleria lovaniensis TaxID=51637 RepID=A0AA88GCV6_NAELO|nr:uncharacterized protein C9374_009833 [Naegleria lovaniensis]KAG2375210.1 hypothetical protein C9374_009833 [Naegleria lovaniensis]